MVRVTNSLLTVRGRLTFPATLARVIAERTNWFLEMPDTASAMPMWLYTLIPTYLHGSISSLLNGGQVSDLRVLEVWSWDCPCTVYNIVVVYSSCTSLPANTSSHSIPLESLPLTGLGATATRSVYSKVDNGRIPLTSPENHIKKCRMTVGMMCMNHSSQQPFLFIQ